MNALAAHILRLWLALTLSLALAASALAHRAPTTADDLALAAFVSAGGAVSDICRDGTGPHQGERGCDACRLVGAALVPAAPTLAPLVQTAAVPAQVRPAPTPRKTAMRSYAHAARAPPAA